MLSLIYGFPLYYRSDRVHLYDHVVFAVEFTGNSVALCAKYNFRSALVCNLDSLWSEGFLFIWQENIFLMFIFIVTSTMFWSNFELQYNSSLFFAFLLCLLLMCLLMSLEDFYFFFFSPPFFGMLFLGVLALLPERNCSLPPHVTSVILLFQLTLAANSPSVCRLKIQMLFCTISFLAGHVMIAQFRAISYIKLSWNI